MCRLRHLHQGPPLGRALWIGPSDELLRQHRQWMQTHEAKSLYARQKELSEPTFGILKDQLGARRFLLRGLPNVRAEFTLLATAFNLRTLWRLLSRPMAGLENRAARTAAGADWLSTWPPFGQTAALAR